MKKVFIRVNKSVSVDDAVAHLESLGYKNIWSGGFTPEGMADSLCGEEDGEIGWMANPTYFQEIGFQEIFLPTTKHKHYDLIVKWAADPSQKVWWRTRSNWNPVIGSPTWNIDCDYHIGEHPPNRKIMIGDIEVDAPEVYELAHNTEYYLPNIGAIEMYSESRWYKDNIDLFRLKTGVIHLNKDAAIAHAKALIKASGGCVDE